MTVNYHNISTMSGLGQREFSEPVSDEISVVQPLPPPPRQQASHPGRLQGGPVLLLTQSVAQADVGQPGMLQAVGC